MGSPSTPPASAPAAPAPAPVPSVIASKLPTTGTRVAAGPQFSGRRAPQAASIFDVTPPVVSATRKQADDTRRALSNALQSLANAKASVDAANATIAADPNAAQIFAQDGLTADVLKQFGDLSTPIITAFTAPAA